MLKKDAESWTGSSLWCAQRLPKTSALLPSVCNEQKACFLKKRRGKGRAAASRWGMAVNSAPQVNVLKGNTHRQRGCERLHGGSSESLQETHGECAGSVHRVILGEEKKGVHQTPPNFQVHAGKSSNKYKACLAPNSKVSPEQTFLSLCLQCV